ncbi:hypothetical protein, partial [Flaviaesturariibacter aridisoli]|uniref:hypothetical protein n=1 Tax=Flaviaesturariibacter aridisoli TaxID=2545761 RepID=UPI001A9EA06D
GWQHVVFVVWVVFFFHKLFGDFFKKDLAREVGSPYLCTPLYDRVVLFKGLGFNELRRFF